MEIGIAVGPRRHRPAVDGVDMRIAKGGSCHVSFLVIHTYNNMTAVRQAFTRESADARRADLIEATAACLAEHGLAGTNVRAICARAGVSPGLLRHYFGGIDDLVAATYQATSDRMDAIFADAVDGAGPPRSEEHTSELQSLMRISYAVFCLKKKKNKTSKHT